VASAVILKTYAFRSKIDDSKKLTPQGREEAYIEIFRKAVVGVGIVDEKTIDDINIYQATRMAMEIAVSNLSIPPDMVIVDGNMRINSVCPCKTIVSGDSKSLSIAAASIIAKVTRDDIMRKFDRLYPAYGFAVHKGYPTKRHKIAIRKHGLSPIHRATFHPNMASIA
jgi:ribonuclease HII